MVSAYYRRLTSQDPEVRQRAAKAWSIWEGSTSKLIFDPGAASKFADAFARIECHYFTNKGFFPEDNYLLNNVSAIKDIPTVIVHGRYDVICPLENAWQLHRALPGSELHIVADAGHSLSEPGITTRMLEYTDKWSG